MSRMTIEVMPFDDRWAVKCGGHERYYGLQEIALQHANAKASIARLQGVDCAVIATARPVHVPVGAMGAAASVFRALFYR